MDHTVLPANTRQLLALCTSGGSVVHQPALECDTNYSQPIAVSFLLTAIANDLLPTMFRRVVRNIDLLERELSQYGYDAICFQYHNI